MNEKIELLLKFKGLICILIISICLTSVVNTIVNTIHIPIYEFPDTNTRCNKATGTIQYFDTFTGTWKYK